MHRFALRLTRDGPAAEDLVQETYLRALAHREQYAPGTNCRAWLFTICRNAFVRGAMRDQREVAVEDAELDDAVRKALDKLPEDYRIVVALVDIEDQSYADAAGILGVPLGTVRSRLFRGRRLLQQDLLAYAVDTGLIPPRAKSKP